MEEILEYLFEDESLTKYMDDEEAIRFYEYMMTLLQELYDMGEDVEILKHKIMYLGMLISEYKDWRRAVREIFHGKEETQEQ